MRGRPLDSTERIRAFVALALPAEVRETCAALIEQLDALGAPARWTRPENLHVTLRFLGSVRADALAQYSEHLREHLAALAPVPLVAAGLGAFPNPWRPSVVWIGVTGDGDGLGAVHRAAEAAARDIGLAAEKRRFRPHITLGRLRDPAAAGALRPAFAQHTAFHAGAWNAQDVALFRSDLTPSGAQHTCMAVLSLGGGRAADTPGRNLGSLDA